MSRATQAGLDHRGVLKKTARTLLVNKVMAEVVDAFDANGISSILLKGPSIARWLYPEGGRTYVDSDLLVPDSQFAQAEALLALLGFASAFEGWSSFEQPVDPQAWTFARAGPDGRTPGTVDLHHTLWGVPVPDEDVWEAFGGPHRCAGDRRGRRAGPEPHCPGPSRRAPRPAGRSLENRSEPRRGPPSIRVARGRGTMGPAA